MKIQTITAVTKERWELVLDYCSEPRSKNEIMKELNSVGAFYTKPQIYWIVERLAMISALKEFIVMNGNKKLFLHQATIKSSELSVVLESNGIKVTENSYRRHKPTKGVATQSVITVKGASTIVRGFDGYHTTSNKSKSSAMYRTFSSLEIV